MKKQLLDQIIKKKENKNEFAIITNIANGESCIFEKNKPLDKNFEKYLNQINDFFNKKKNGIIENTDIFVETYIKQWGKILNISDYGMLWVAFIKGVIIGLLIYHFFIK